MSRNFLYQYILGLPISALLTAVAMAPESKEAMVHITEHLSKGPGMDLPADYNNLVHSNQRQTSPVSQSVLITHDGGEPIVENVIPIPRKRRTVSKRPASKKFRTAAGDPTSWKWGQTLRMETEKDLNDCGDDRLQAVGPSRPIVRDKAGKLFEVYDWSFLREDGWNEKTESNQRMYLRYLNKLAGQKQIKRYDFSIPRNQAATFLEEFSQRGKKFHEYN
ncbi:hypothetical protein PCANC_09506 [Puccinia coronata f. sp. avenae]|uniref:Uncharacterized protein n=2 Tax=Puccinia coronata f. sp. avenae TaxID=200324 RepID=A0A2N5T691_9BASI|nr:hypothetical protein PCANC_11274 [Puccinia coronata f. sp. avenae]PLW54028.1 hypothetical protein PCANC_09506 [Puccinia coronata f. sp. avenae]